jgi:carbonic anhydrase
MLSTGIPMARFAGFSMAAVFVAGFLPPLAALAGDESMRQAERWGYIGKWDPARWDEMSPEYALCGKGTQQSPIDISDPEPAEMAPIRFDYKPVPLTIWNNGHTIRVDIPKGSSITVGDRRFELTQFHFHSASEHKVDGKAYPLEIHFVHRNDQKQLAVVGVFVEAGEENLGAREIWKHLPPNEVTAPKTHADVIVNGRDLLPAEGNYFRYMGSLTTPPCTEGINWFVLRQPIVMSQAQIDAMATILHGNARPIQARNDRLLLDGVVRQ